MTLVYITAMFRAFLIVYVLSSAPSDWFMNGNYLIIIVTVCIILPLALMKHLGTSAMFLTVCDQQGCS